LFLINFRHVNFFTISKSFDHMKRLHTCALALVLLGVFSISSVQTTVAQDSKKVVVIKKKVDENGQQTVERIVAEGDDVDELMLQMAEGGEHAEDIFFVNKSAEGTSVVSFIPEKGSNITVDVNEKNGKKNIRVNVDGKIEVIQLEPGEELSEETRLRLAEKGVILGDGHSENGRSIVWHGDNEDSVFNIGGISKGMVAMGKSLAHLGDAGKGVAIWNDYSEGINCAALGVYVSTAQSGGTYVSNIIGASGAEEAGIQRGDIITSIDEYPTNKYRELHEALAMFEPGDVVTVTFKRGEDEQRVEAQLRAWKELPSFANRPHARVSCDKETEEVVTRKIIVIKKDKEDEPAIDEPANVNLPPIDTYLELSDFTAFPNPTDGKFSVRFSAEAVPTVVTVYNSAGKEVFRDNLENFSGNYTREIDLTSQVRGGLVLSIEQGGKVFTEQIILN
jgi:hypothetical protein